MLRTNTELNIKLQFYSNTMAVNFYNRLKISIPIGALHKLTKKTTSYCRGGGVNMERGGNMERSISQKLKTISGVSL